MTDYVEVMERADRAAHDVAQLHLREFNPWYEAPIQVDSHDSQDDRRTERTTGP